MKRALVTGGCGFLGSWITRLLVEDGVAVRVLAVPGEARDNLAGLAVEVVEGDVRSVDDCKRAVEGVDTVFHAAAIYQDWAPDPTLMYDVNLRGTFHVVEASRQAGVGTVVYTASMVSIGRPEPGDVADERAPYECWELDFPYSRSKFFSRELCEYFGAWGYDVRVVCPGIVLGPNDIRPTPSGKLIVNAMRGQPAVYFDGGVNMVDVRDAARVHVLAATRGAPGERYLATGHNVTNQQLIAAIDEVLGRKRRLVRLPTVMARALAMAGERHALARGTAPLLVRDFFEYSLRPSFYRNDKARRELGAEFRPLRETIADAVDYFRARGV